MPFVESDDFLTQGYALVADALSPARCAELCEGVKSASSLSGGTRSLLREPWCMALAGELQRHPPIARCLPADSVAVQCTYFEKSAHRNWLVPLHQDVSIAVQSRSDAPGYSAWSTKEGMVFVQPPLEVLQSLVAVRLHLDACGPQDGPLQVVAGSHSLGLIESDAAGHLRQSQGLALCAAHVGGVLVMKPLLLHASSKATGGSRRRVLHFVFGTPTLPSGVRWHDAVR